MSMIAKRSNSSQSKTPTPAQPAKAVDAGPPVRMKTWSELSAYLAKHLKPVRRGPKGQPIYSHEEMESLNIIWPDED